MQFNKLYIFYIKHIRLKLFALITLQKEMKKR
jgi:hypothetical protein